jgi:hypothetical protein
MYKHMQQQQGLGRLRAMKQQMSNGNSKRGKVNEWHAMFLLLL